ncbi:MAG: ABC transporter permease [Tissierellia bacterium]|nr:ABC transporter permease [Tissierellia bacterium]
MKKVLEKIKMPLLAVTISLIFGAIVILLLKKNPLEAYSAFLQGAGLLPKANYGGNQNQLSDFFVFLDGTAPMIFASLAIVISLKGGLFNIGVAGQMLLSGFFATILVGYSPLPGLVAKPIVILIGLVVGGILGGIVGYLKAKFNINEVVSTIMFNYIIQYTTSYFIQTSFVDPVSRQSKYILSSASLTFKGVSAFGVKLDISISFFLAILVAIYLNYFLNKKKDGFEIKMVGLNRKGSEYAGVNVEKTIIKTMVISGALAGLAGVSYYLGYMQSIQPGVLGSLGFNAIATALLGGVNSIGVIFASLLLTILDRGSVFMSSRLGIVKEISGVITSIILIFSAISGYIGLKLSERKKEER